MRPEKIPRARIATTVMTGGVCLTAAIATETVTGAAAASPAAPARQSALPDPFAGVGMTSTPAVLGAVTFHGMPVGQGYQWTNPLEGVAIRPPWA